jgi:hypothetical protein
MKTRLISILIMCLFFVSNNTIGQTEQDITILNKFKSIHLPPLEYYVTNELSQSVLMYDVYGVREMVKNTLLSKGFNLIESTNVHNDSKREDCSIGYCNILHYSELNENIIDGVGIVFTDCNYEVVYSSKAKVTSLVAEKTLEKISIGKIPVLDATKTALKEFNSFKYKYDENLLAKKKQIPIANLTEKQYYEYFKNNEVSEIEGVHNSRSVDFYILNIAIIKNDEAYDIIVLKTNNPSWNQYEIRGNFSLINGEYIGTFLFTNNDELDIRFEIGKKHKMTMYIADNYNNEIEVEFKRKMP